jgi:hypothetical protein
MSISSLSTFSAPSSTASLDIKIKHKASEAEICFYSLGTGLLLGSVWFGLADLVDECTERQLRGAAVDEEQWIDVIPAGKVLLKAYFGRFFTILLPFLSF